MHRTQVMLEEQQYERLKRESESTGRSIGDLVREAIESRYGHSQDELWAALAASRGAWADRDEIGDGAEYVERVRSQPIGERLARLGWD